jgi:FkbM family methyltransferase
MNIPTEKSLCFEYIKKLKSKNIALNIVLIGTNANPSPFEEDNSDLKLFSMFDETDTIYGFEPFTDAYLLCKDYFKKYYPGLNVKLLNYAIGEIDGEVDLYQGTADWISSKTGVHGTLITPNKHKGVYNNSDVIKVKSMTVEMFLKVYTISTIDILIIDAEGYDYEIVKKYFSLGIFPCMLFFEHTNFIEGISAISVSDEINNLGMYDIFIGDQNMICIKKGL